jgi:hypothetical protein
MEFQNWHTDCNLFSAQQQNKSDKAALTTRTKSCGKRSATKTTTEPERKNKSNKAAPTTKTKSCRKRSATKTTTERERTECFGCFAF